MTNISFMGLENKKQGICGFTSTLYAVYTKKPELQKNLERALSEETRSTRLLAEIKTFLQTLKANKNPESEKVLQDITELTRSFPNFGLWTVDSYIGSIDVLGKGATPDKEVAVQEKIYSIAMPPDAMIKYISSWGIKPKLTDSIPSGVDCILGLTRPEAPSNKWKNLAHYVYQDGNGKIYSWGKQFQSLTDLNNQETKDYSIIYRIRLS